MRVARFGWGLVLMAVIMFMPSVGAQDSTTHTGDLFGDLVHIKRHAVTGQPILQKRMIESPGDVVDWGYCAIPVDKYGFEIPLVDLSCDVDPAAASRLVSVDYFGRLSAGRTKESNMRMHFDEVISNIKKATVVDVDASGRMVLGSDCAIDGTCATWKTIDSPLENLALYRRLMKWGHFQTDPLEVDNSSGGDPAAGTVYRPALDAADWAKFRSGVSALLPSADASSCFSGTSFVTTCAAQQSLTTPDFIRAAVFLAGASDKHGKTTMDLVQFMNRILKIPVATPETPATLNTLPALIRDENGVIAPAPAGLPAPANERFMDYTPVSYLRSELYSGTFPSLVATGDGMWREETGVSVLPFLRKMNGAMDTPVVDTFGFVKAVSDGQRAIEFIHEYTIPVDISAPGAATITTVPNQTAMFSAADQTVVLEARVTDTAVVNVGTFTFTLMTAGGTAIGTPTVSGIVTNGVAQAGYTLPANTPRQTFVILADYSGGLGFAASYGLGSLELTVATTTTTIAPASAPTSATDQTVPLRGTVTVPNASPVNVGTMTFTVRDSGGTTIGAPLTSAVVSNVANASYVLPGGVADQALTITGVFSGAADFLGSTGIGTLTVGCPAVVISPATLPQATLNAAYSVALTFSGTAPATASLVGTLPPGLTMTTAGVISGVPTQNGAYPFTVEAVDGGGCTGSRAYILTVGPALTFLAGMGASEAPMVKAFTITGTPGVEFTAFDDPTFLGGVRVAAGDLNLDGVFDTISGAGVNGGARVTVKDGASGVIVRDFSAFAEYLADGVYVASGDLNNDGFSDIVVGAGSGVARIRVFSGRDGGLLREFTAFEGQLTTGVRVGAADLNADGYADIIAGAGPGGTPTVQVFDGASGVVLTTFNAYTELFGGGVFVAGADVSGDGYGDIITGAGEGGGPHVRIWDGRTFAEIMGFYAFEPTFTGGVRVAGSDLNRDGKAEIITGRGPGGLMTVNVFDGATGALVSSFLAEDADCTAGLYVAGNGSLPRMSVDLPPDGATVATTFAMGGWAFDSASVSGVGVDSIHVWAYSTNGGVPVFVGLATLGGDRPDVAAAFGDAWRYSGFNLNGTLAPGVYDLVVYVHSSVSGTFNNRRVVRITVQ